MFIRVARWVALTTLVLVMLLLISARLRSYAAQDRPFGTVREQAGVRTGYSW